ncbi:BMP family ABC transporter substrate-binding protein [Nitratireductor sp. CAU 1489]|uniref:BMP family ABC transporter substrate-binding protein n=1 Tax=Nitratireductor arenosus TaxID=2682096 RepID=A0A844QN82_9HYPH|nr:BMP family protein [Nitratireductor arenosus]MVA99400.1 BMP family ABC transporter substrate-binding protein [Nitratireductor arenosus]
MKFSRRTCLAALAGLTMAGATGPALADDFKMGLLVPGSVAEEGWNRIAYDALLRVEKELGADISYVELHENPSAFENAFRNYASQGYDVVLGHGFQFQDAALTVAADFPDTTFLISSSHVFDGNVIGLNTDSSEPFYLMGVIAAMTGKSAGLVGGLEIPPIKQSFEGFINGARSVDPNFPISQVYVGSFTDSTAAKEAAVGMIARGANIVVPNANAAGLGVVQAAREAGPDVQTFSVYSDYTEAAPENTLGVYVADYGQGIVRIVSQIKDGSFEAAGNIVFGLKDTDVMMFSYNDHSARSVPDDVRRKVEEVKNGIIAGEIATRAD